MERNPIRTGTGDKSLTTQEIAEIAGETCLAARVRRMSRIVTRHYDYALRSKGLTAAQFTLLTAIAEQDGVTAADIVGELDIEKSTLSRNLKRLVHQGLVRMDPPAGRRGRGLHLTPKGDKTIRQAYGAWRAAQEAVEATLGRDSVKIFDRLIRAAEKLSGS